MDEFEKMVRECRIKELPRVIENASIEHALTLFENLFDMAIEKSRDVRIVSGCLTEGFYSKLIDRALKAMDAGINVKVVVLDPSHLEKDKNTFYKTIDGHRHGEVSTLSLKTEHYMPHFIVVGTEAYRLETDDKKKTAVACFKDSAIAPQLVNLHKRLATIASAHP